MSRAGARSKGPANARAINMAQLSGMTGFARTEASFEQFSWVWEARSVNGKGLEARFRFPGGYDRLEAGARDLAKARFARGNIQASLTLNRDAAQAALRIDTRRIDAILDAAEPYVVSGRVLPVSFDGLLTVRGVLDVEDRSEPEDADELDAALLESLALALDSLRNVRLVEGGELKALLSGHVDTIEALTHQAEISAAVRLDAIRDRIAAKYAELLPQGLDPERLATEAAALAVKMDVREELDRLHAHIRAARELLDAGSPTGRKLDFLSQEFNREANTLCSKSSDSSLTQIGLAMKNAVDQFREQVQNVE